MGVYEVTFFAPRSLKGTFTTYAPCAYMCIQGAYVVQVPFRGHVAKNVTSQTPFKIGFYEHTVMSIFLLRGL